jgi:hypothetical protein
MSATKRIAELEATALAELLRLLRGGVANELSAAFLAGAVPTPDWKAMFITAADHAERLKHAYSSIADQWERLHKENTRLRERIRALDNLDDL